MAIPSHEQVALLTDYDTSSAYSTAYYQLYTNIRLHWNDEHTKQHTVLLATPTQYAGQAAAVANIAIAAAQNGTPTIVVDANRQRPSLQQRFGISEHKGFTDLLQETSITSEAIAASLCETFVPNLRLLCTGKASLQESRLLPFEALQRVLTGLRQFVAETEHVPGLILFNSGPVLTSPDTTQLASLAEHTFLTIINGYTTRKQAKHAQEQLQHGQATLSGVILLDV